MTLRRCWSYLQLLRKAREDPATFFRDDYHVFQAHPPHAGLIQTWFDSEYLSILQDHLLQTGMFVNFQAQSVASTMEKSNAPTIAHSSWKTAAGKEFLNGFVDRHAINAGLDLL